MTPLESRKNTSQCAKYIKSPFETAYKSPLGCRTRKGATERAAEDPSQSEKSLLRIRPADPDKEPWLRSTDPFSLVKEATVGKDQQPSSFGSVRDTHFN